MRTVEEIGKIFIDEAKKVIENHYPEFSDLTNAMLNKSEDSAEKYQVLLHKFKDCLPNRGVTKEEFDNFMPYLTDYMVDLIPYIIKAMNGKEIDNESNQKGEGSTT